MLAEKTPMLAAPEVKAILACVVHDNIEPALDALKEASCLTDEDLWEDFFIAREGRLPYPPLTTPQ
jgi:hypothetical protein